MEHHQHIHCPACQRPPSAQLEFFCCSCARGTVYRTRVSNIQAILDKERLSGEVAGALDPAAQDPGSSAEDGDSDGADLAAAARTARLRRVEVERLRSAEVAQSCKDTCAEMRRDVAALKASIAQRRDEAARRRAKGSERKAAMAAQMPRAMQAPQEAAQKAEADWAKLHTAICEDRVLLCREVAMIYGLEVKKRRRDAGGRDVYLLGGVPLVDLRDLNNASPTLISVSAARLAHMLHLASHYLSVQLPAQIDLPSPTNPHTVIHTPTTSYKEPALPSGRKATAAQPPAAAKSRQRLLHVDKPLPALAAEDPVAYSLFVDAAALLAWDLAWLAKTQGIDVGARRWDDVCAVGRNAWLLFGPRPAPPPRAGPADLSPLPPPPHLPLVSSPMARASSGGSGARRAPPRDDEARSSHPGYFSHGSARAFLPAAAAAGGMADAMRSWQFASPIRLIERIKAALANDRAGAEWEMLDRDEWAAEEMAAREESGGAHDAADQAQGQPQAPPPVTGWMRLRTKTAGLL